MYGRGILVYEFDGALRGLSASKQPCTRGGTGHTAMLYSPHFSVSGLRLFRLTCHLRGTSRSVAM